jgi:predicted  nucleic acid-binding Zn-ribbon protein
MLYVNPLGKVTNLDISLNELIPRATPNSDPLFNYKNKINNLKEDSVLNKARLEDIEKKYASNKLYFLIYSIFACIFIIMLLVFLKNLNR